MRFEFNFLSFFIELYNMREYSSKDILLSEPAIMISEWFVAKMKQSFL